MNEQSEILKSVTVADKYSVHLFIHYFHLYILR